MAGDGLYGTEQIEQWLHSINPSELQSKIKYFRALNFKEMSDVDISGEISKALMFNNKFLFLCQIPPYPASTKFFRIRKLEGSSVRNKNLSVIADFWNPPSEILTSYGRLNRPYESLLYTALNPFSCLEEMKINADEYFAIIKYIAKYEIKINFIGHDCDYEKWNITSEKAKFIHGMLNNFLKDEFSRDVGEGTEYLYKISQIIRSYYFDLPPDVAQDAWGYVSTQNKKDYNVCFRPEIAKKKLELIGATICKRDGERIKSVGVTYGFDDNGYLQPFEIGSDIQKTYFPEANEENSGN